MKKIAFVGTAKGEMDAPFDDESFEIWCMNWNTPHYPRVTLDFEIHAYRKGEPVTPVKNKNPTISQDNFPHEWIEKHFPRYLNDYFYKSSLDYMAAYAAYLHKTAKKKEDKVGVIKVCGVHMALNDDEYFKQQPSFHAWIGYLLGLGIEVIIDDHSPLMKSTFTYGLGEVDSEDPLYNIRNFSAQRQKHQDSINKLSKEIKEKQDMIQAQSGSLQIWDILLKMERARLAGQKIENMEDLIKVYS